MKYLYLIASFCITSLGARLTDGYSTRLIARFSPQIEPRDPSDHEQLRILKVRADKPSKSSIALQGGQAKDSTKQSPKSPTRSSTNPSGAKPKAHQETSPSPKQQKDSPTEQASISRLSKTQEPTSQRQLTLPTSLLNTKLGAARSSCPAPCNRTFLRRKTRLTENKRPKIRYGQPDTSGEPGTAGFAWVKGPASIQKFAGEHGIQRSSEIKANEQAIVKVRHKTAVSIGGVARHGGSITAMLRGDSVGVWVDAMAGGHGYIQDESDNKVFKDADKRTLDVPSGDEIRKEYRGDTLLGSMATVKAEIKGPGVLSMAGMRIPSGAAGSGLVE